MAEYFEVSQGIVHGAQKVVIYGPEGIGKSTFLSKFPKVLFIDTEGSTKRLDVRRLPAPSSWTMLLDEVRYVRDGKVAEVQTLAIDTADWAERACAEHICAKAKKNGIEDFGYGNGYTYLSEEFGRLLDLLDEVAQKGINVAIAAHAQLVKFEQPDEVGAYDRWELKLGVKKTEKRTAQLLKEWADAVLFANYETFVVKTETKNKAQGGRRVMYTTHMPTWDAKNRWGLADKLNFDYAEIAAFIPGEAEQAQKAETPREFGIEVALSEVPEEFREKYEAQSLELEPQKSKRKAEQPKPKGKDEPPAGVPAKLYDLMRAAKVNAEEVQAAVAYRGFYPKDTPIGAYDPEFVEGVLIGAWPQVRTIIYKLRGDKQNG